jgi:hypothetical protein
MKRWLGLSDTSIDAIPFTELGLQPVKLAEILDQGKVSAPSRMQAAAAIFGKRKGHPVMREAQKWVAPHIANLQLNVNRKPDKVPIQEVSSHQVAAKRPLSH